jgi:hypothetical protein
MLSTKELVLKTVIHLERRPQCYRYACNRIPQSAYSVGCILGWMAYFADEHEDDVLTPAVIARITCDPPYACEVGYNDFFMRLDECYPIYRGHWRSDATHAVNALREYAAKYPEAPGLLVWARMRDREAVAALPAQHEGRVFRERRPRHVNIHVHDRGRPRFSYAGQPSAVAG